MAPNKTGGYLDLKRLPAVIGSVKTLIGFSALCVIMLAAALSPLSAWMSANNQTLLIACTFGLLALVITGTFFIAIRQSISLTGGPYSPSTVKADDVESRGLGAAVKMTLEQNEKIKVLRVFALTSGQLAPLLYQLIDEVFVGEVRVILFDPTANKLLSNETIEKIKQSQATALYYLNQIKTKVQRSEVKFQPLCPAEYYVIADDHAMTLGNLKYDPSSFTYFRAQKPFNFRASGSMADLIRAKAELFDSWFGAL